MSTPALPTVLITGAARRLGREMALALAAAGWQVAVHYRGSADEAQATVADCTKAGRSGARFAAFQADLSDEAATRALKEPKPADVRERVAKVIRDKIADLMPSFPREVMAPRVTRSMEDENQQPIVDLAVYSSERPLREISNIVEQVIIKRLQTAPGVGNVTVSGGVPRQIQVQLKPEQMRSYGVGVDEVVAAIQSANHWPPCPGETCSSSA
jgi:NAD(P)-dependent dehydrogenase (short-subunit alcohol dehydrogenase family)